MATLYPDYLPNGRVLFTASPKHSTIDTKVASAGIVQRNRFNEVRQSIDIEFSYTLDQMEVFKAWYKHKIHNGTSSFDITLDLNESPEVFNCKIIGGAFGSNLVSHNQWAVHFSILVEDPKIMTEDEVDVIIAANPNP
jgi:hypothetical protein